MWSGTDWTYFEFWEVEEKNLREISVFLDLNERNITMMITENMTLQQLHPDRLE